MAKYVGEQAVEELISKTKQLVSTKQDKLTAGTNITIKDNVISAEGGASIIIDDTLSSTSTNPVQNKVINTALLNKQDKLTPENNIYISKNHIGFITNVSVENGVVQTNGIMNLKYYTQVVGGVTWTILEQNVGGVYTIVEMWGSYSRKGSNATVTINLPVDMGGTDYSIQGTPADGGATYKNWERINSWGVTRYQTYFTMNIYDDESTKTKVWNFIVKGVIFL